MYHLIADEHVHSGIVRGMLLRRPRLDFVTVHEAGLRGSADAVILAQAAADDRIVITQDRSTMIPEAAQRVVNGQRMPGLWVLRPNTSIGHVIDAIELMIEASESEEWDNLIVHIPL